MSKLMNNINGSEAEESFINDLYTRMMPTSSDNYHINSIGSAYRLAYLKMDHLLSRGINETSSTRWSGVSAFTAVVETNDNIEELLLDLDANNPEKTRIILGHIHVANCGKIDLSLF